MRIEDIKPKTSIEPSDGSFQSSANTYSNPLITYSSPTTQYGGFYGYSEKGPETTAINLIPDIDTIQNIISYNQIQPSLGSFQPSTDTYSSSSIIYSSSSNQYGGFYGYSDTGPMIQSIRDNTFTTGDVILGGGVPMGLLLTLTYPTTGTA